MSSVKYINGKQPHKREYRMIFRNVDRQGWDTSIKSYIADGGYKQLKKAIKMKPQEVIDEVKASGLRGRGGAGFPTGVKWGFIPQITRNLFILFVTVTNLNQVLSKIDTLFIKIPIS